MPPVTVTAPATSRRRLARRPVDSLSDRTAPTISAIPIGTFTKRTHRQPSRSVRTPPAKRPAAAPLAAVADQTPRARRRSWCSVKVAVSRLNDAGARMAPPIPWAARAAINSPLLEASLEGARGLLLNVSGPSDLGLFEVNEAAEIVRETAHPDANIIFGAVIDDAMGDEVRITVIAAGFDRFDGERGEAAPARRETPSTPRVGRRPDTARSGLGLDADDGGDDDGGDDEFDVPEFLR